MPPQSRVSVVTSSRACLTAVNVFSTCLCAADGVDKNNNRMQNTSMFCKRLLFLSTPSTAHKHVEKTLTGVCHFLFPSAAFPVRRRHRSHSQRFCDVALKVKFYCDCDVAKSLRMGPHALKTLDVISVGQITKSWKIAFVV